MQRSFAACACEVMRPDLIMRSIIPVVTSSARRLAFQPSSAVLFIIRLYTLKFVLISFRSFFLPFPAAGSFALILLSVSAMINILLLDGGVSNSLTAHILLERGCICHILKQSNAFLGEEFRRSWPVCLASTGSSLRSSSMASWTRRTPTPSQPDLS